MIGHHVRHASMSVGVAVTLAVIATEASSQSTISHSLRRASSTTLRVALPERSYYAKGGHQLLKELAKLSLAAREEALIREILAGNVPRSMRTLVPVKLLVQGPLNKMVKATSWVLPDYLAVGSDIDFVHVPLSLPGAQRLAKALGLSLPTVPIVEAIYDQADVRLTPKPLPPTSQMNTIDYLLRHEEMLANQLAGVYKPRNLGRPMLIAGHKKDVVLSKRLAVMKGRIAIFGWHRSSKVPIQPLSTVHDASYVDYSHGIRLVAPTVVLDTPVPSSAIAVSNEDAMAPAPQPSRLDYYRSHDSEEARIALMRREWH